MKKTLIAFCTIAALSFAATSANAQHHSGGGGHAGGGHVGGGGHAGGGHPGGGGFRGGGGWVAPAIIGGAILGGGAYMLNRDYDDSDCWRFRRVRTPDGYIATQRVNVCY